MDKKTLTAYLTKHGYICSYKGSTKTMYIYPTHRVDIDAETRIAQEFGVLPDCKIVEADYEDEDI